VLLSSAARIAVDRANRDTNASHGFRPEAAMVKKLTTKGENKNENLNRILKFTQLPSFLFLCHLTPPLLLVGL